MNMQTGTPGQGLRGGILLLTLAVGLAGPAQAENLWDKLKAAAKQAQQQSSQRSSPASAANTTQIKSFDVLGLALGMGFAEAEAVLKKKFPDYHVLPVNYRGFGQEWAGLLVAMPKTKHKSEVVLVDFTLPPLERRVIAITRYKEFPPSATPSLQNVEKGLRNKYGAWTRAELAKRGASRKIYGWWTTRQPSTCFDEKLYAQWGRLREIVDEGTLSRVLGDAYGDITQFVKPFRKFASINANTPHCGKQIIAEAGLLAQQNMVLTNKLVTVVADFPAYLQSEVAFSRMAKAYNRQQAQRASQRGGVPEL